jgi:hypothetical protein
MRMSSDELGAIRWKGEGAYRSLSYYFTARWNHPRLGEFVNHVLDPFAVPPDPSRNRVPPTPGLPAAYSLIDMGPKQEPRFHLLYGEDLLIATAKRDEVLRHLFWHVNLETCWQTGDFVLIHAGAVVTPNGEGVLLPAKSGSGKTTVTAGLVRAGFGYLSDEAAAIDPVTRRIYPYPKTLNIKKGSFKLFPDFKKNNGELPPVQGEWHLSPNSIRPGAIGGPCPVRFVIAPRYREGAATALAPTGRAETLTALWESLWNLSYGGRALHLLADVMRSARGYQLEYGDYHEAVDVIADLTSAPARSRSGRARAT